MISTNDVLTSWFFTRTNCSLAFLCVDVRPILLAGKDGEGNSSRQLGRNHWNSIVYEPAAQNDTCKAWKIRQAVQTGQRVNGSGPLVAKKWASASSAVATNWVRRQSAPSSSSSSSSIRLHLPLYDFATYCPAGFCVMRTFTPRPGQTGVYVAGDAELLSTALLPSCCPSFLTPVTNI